jgi:hypothetical protein
VVAGTLALLGPRRFKRASEETEFRLSKLRKPLLVPGCAYFLRVFAARGFAFAPAAISFARNLAMSPISFAGTFSARGKRMVPLLSS